jgi:hypothetical protein
MDYSEVNDFVDTREVNFLSNHKSWRHDDPDWPFATVATTILTSDAQGHNATIQAQVSHRAEIVAQRAWDISSLEDSDRLDAYVASLLRSSDIDSAEMVLVNPDLLFRNEFVHRMSSRLLEYYKNEQNKPVVGYIEKEMIEIYRLLGWCWDEAMRTTISVTFASYSCFRRGRAVGGWA